jgi:glycosyltransferase involved in cell wall biosynthesis
VNGGLAAALNFLLEIVLKNPDYKFIARMDADDISSSERFQRQHEFLMSNSDISCVGSWYEEIDEAGRHLSYRKLPVSHEDLIRRFRIRVPFAHPSVMFSRNLIEKAGYYPVDTMLMEDSVLWGMALKAGLKFANVPELLLKFRIDEKFFSRRSGFKYGWKFIITRFRVNKALNFPSHTYLYILMAGIIKMMPSFFLSYVYKAVRRN